jgi:hypothetical protein
VNVCPSGTMQTLVVNCLLKFTHETTTLFPSQVLFASKCQVQEFVKVLDTAHVLKKNTINLIFYVYLFQVQSILFSFSLCSSLQGLTHVFLNLVGGISTKDLYCKVVFV